MGQQKVKCIPWKPLRNGAIHTGIRCNEKCIPNRKMSRRSELDSAIDELKKNYLHSWKLQERNGGYTWLR